MSSVIGSSVLGALPGVGGVATPNALGGIDAGKTASQAAGSDFGQLLAQLSGEAVQTLKAAEHTSVAAIGNKISAQQAVESILAAERTLQTTIAVRDKLVGAYQEISRLSI